MAALKATCHQQKLYYLIETVHLKVSAPAERPKDANVEVRGQRPIDTKAGSHQSVIKARGQKQRKIRFGIQIKRFLLTRSGPELEDK